MPLANKNKPPQLPKSQGFIWDRNLLVGFIVVLSLVLIILNREANTFLPDARLYPYVMTMAGLIFCALSIVRIVMGKEPNADAQNGKGEGNSTENIQQTYKKILFYLGIICLFYAGIWLVGFRVAAVAFVFVFIKSFGHSLTRSAIYAVCGSLMIELLVYVLQLQLPLGLLGELLGD